MPTPPMEEWKYLEAHAAVARYGSVSGAATAMGIARGTMEKRYNHALDAGLGDVRTDIKALANPRLGMRGRLTKAPPPAPEDFVVTRHSAETDQDGNVRRQWTGSKPPPGDHFLPIHGHVIKGESALVDAEGRTLAKWVKTREGASVHLAEALREAFSEFSGLMPNTPPPTATLSDLLTLYPVPDLHLGMYSWAKETGEDYNIDVATSVAMQGIDHLIGQSLPSEKAIILVLGDYLHADSQKNVTPASGHQLDVDGRRPKVYRAGVDLLMRMVERAKARHASVDVVIIPGNHDPDSALTITVALSIAYSADQRVTVSDGPNTVWYYRFGRVLLGATHGDKMKPDAMAMMLAHDCPQEWGYTWHKHFYFGHIHHQTAREVGPVIVESFNSPAARDAHSHGSGYRSGRAMTAITFHREGGEIGRHKRSIATNKRRVRVKAVTS